jgi:hypothetical protein
MCLRPFKFRLEYLSTQYGTADGILDDHRQLRTKHCAARHWI